MDVPDFNPPAYLRSPHAQTVLSSRVTSTAPSRPAAEHVDLEIARLPDSPRLTAKLDIVANARALVVLIHGWLGDAESTYNVRVAAALNAEGLSTARLVLRDHGETEALNEGVFNSAKLDEVVAAVEQLHDRASPGATAIVGFSLGGNFALRVASARARGIEQCVAVCPVIDPAATVRAIDRGWFVYQHYFMRKWRRSLAAKQNEFPDIYQLDNALSLSSVSALTDFVVTRHLPFPDANAYYAGYRITDALLARAQAQIAIIAAADDPVIPIDDVRSLERREGLRIFETQRGGHCGHLEGLQRTWIDRAVTRLITNALD